MLNVFLVWIIEFWYYDYDYDIMIHYNVIINGHHNLSSNYSSQS